MRKPLEPVQAGADLPYERRPQPPPDVARRPPARTADEPAGGQDIRLTIEPAVDGVGFVYRITDRVSGIVIAELPREAVQAAGESEDYASGDIINTRA